MDTRRGGLFLPFLILTLVGVTLNLIPARLALQLGLPLFLDTIGTVLATLLGGFLPGVFAGFIYNFIGGLDDPITIYYGVINILIATVTVFLKNRGRFERPSGLAIAVLVYALIGGGLGSLLTWCLYGFSFGEGISAPFVNALYSSRIFLPIFAQLIGDFLIDVFDKAIVVAVVLFVYRVLPQSVKDYFSPLDISERSELEGLYDTTLRRSLLNRIVSFLALIQAALIVVVCTVCFFLYRSKTFSSYEELCSCAAQYVARAVDPSRVDEFLEKGELAEGYLETERQLNNILRSIDDLTYVYVYRMEEDGIHVVFDLDEIDEEGNVMLAGAEPGSVIEYDVSFAPYHDALLAGEDIDPIVTNDTYGWLMTVYEPIRDADGVTQAYACADIAVIDLVADISGFLAKIVSLLLSTSILVLYMAIYYAEKRLVAPINSIERSLSSFAFGKEGQQEASLEALKAIDIKTGDEIERLYNALVKITSDSNRYIGEIRANAEEMEKLQEAIIIDFASMVEARDQCTGDHIQKTAYYVDIIAQEMLKEGIYPNELDQTLAEGMVRAAPLHDVGKIKISDTLLNKPRRLTDEEFELMKTHTTEGMKILSQTLTSTSDVGYLKESIDMAWCHHEWWDGSGYPRGLVGEQIPLAARVMAVADVFDALVSRRSYKKPFSFDKAIAIIREESGTHFDPKVAAAFLALTEELRPMVEKSQRKDAEEHPEDYA
jgi:HD-GYP domain-containing protein (c-di-GMP phosphodiesterase class II)